MVAPIGPLRHLLLSSAEKLPAGYSWVVSGTSKVVTRQGGKLYYVIAPADAPPVTIPALDPTTRLINQAVYFSQEEWTRTGKSRKGSLPLINPVEFSATTDPNRPGQGLWPQIVPNQSSFTTISITLDPRLDVLINPASFPDNIGPGTLMTISQFRNLLCRNVKLGGPIYSGSYVGVRTSFINATGQVMVEGCSGDTFINSDVLYLGAVPGSGAIAIVQGNRFTGASGTDDTYFTVDNFGTQQNVQTLTDARILSATTAQITVSGAFPGGAPTTANKITIAGTKIETVNRKSQNLNQKWKVTSVVGNVINLGMDTAGGDVLTGISNQTYPIVADVSSAQAWIMGVSGDGTVQGSHSDGMGQYQSGRFSVIWSHNNVVFGSYQPGGIIINGQINLSNCLIGFDQNLNEPQERRSLAIKVGSLSNAILDPIVISDVYIDASQRPWVTTPPVSPGPDGSNAITPFGGSQITTADGYAAYSYGNGVDGPIIGGFILNKAPPRDFAPLATVGPTGVHPGLTAELGTPTSSDVTGVALSNYSTNSGIDPGADIAEVSTLGLQRPNTIIDITVTGTYANYLKMWGRILQRGRLPLPVGDLSVEFTVKVYPIDPVTHGRGALAYTKVFNRALSVASTGSPTTINAVTQTPIPASIPDGTNPSYVWSAVPSGTANTIRTLYIPVTVFAGSTRTINSMTWGPSAKPCTLVPGTRAVSGNMQSAVYKIDLGASDGGTGDIVLTMSGSCSGAGIGVEAVTGVGTLYDTATFAAATYTAPDSFSVYVPAGGLAIAYGGYSTAPTSGNKQFLYAKQSGFSANGQLTVSPSYSGTNFDFGAGFTEKDDRKVGASGGSPATAGGVLVLGPAT